MSIVLTKNKFILIYRIFSNLIRTSFCRFLKRKKKSKFVVLIRTFPSTAPWLQGRLIEKYWLLPML